MVSPGSKAHHEEPARGGHEPTGVTLEWELALDSSDLRSHAWFHGRLGRMEAEELLSSDGDFLVRESASQPGEFVLSCRWNGNNVHFMVNKVRIKPDTIYETEQFVLEDEPYETIPHLITSYVGVERAVSAATGARIRRPVNRTAAIGGGQTPAPAGGRLSWRRSLTGRSGRRADSAEQLSSSGAPRLCSSGSLPRLSAAPLYQKPGRLLADQRSPPPKPDRFEGREYAEIPDIPEQPAPAAVGSGSGSGSDSGHGSGDSAADRAAGNRPPAAPAPALAPVELSPASAFDVGAFETILLPLTHNAPLDRTALRGVIMELLETEPAQLAATLTAWDLRLLHGDGRDRGLGVTCGIELLTLPQGQQLRMDVLERSEWFSAFVIASVVSLEDDDQRVRTINRWIEVAIETKTALGNLYGFANVVQALCSSQVQRLYTSWHQVRQRFTSSAVQFDAQLAPWVRRAAYTADEAPNTCIPHVAPLAALLEEPLAAEQPVSEQLDAALHLLSEGRRMATECDTYRRNARAALAARPASSDGDGGPRDDLFRTEFHLRLLAGSKAATAADQQRRREELLPRVHKVLAVLAEQRDPSPT
ncbi:SH2 domain-containing protein 3A [Amphibalanus amphitrite]|uniref:SH2 domain-containing protein 3A n=1 Tax=Amphibalanus amphitrite TaxID=1232801 RepID=A0A6A4VDN2_AMPAM|nr:SH2 domain-containing protein 3A [Amphibalanus amphitrite]